MDAEKKTAGLANVDGSSTEPLHIVFGIDENYFRGMGVTIVSILKNNPGMSFVFHVFSFSFSDNVRRRMQQLEAQYGIEIRNHLVRPDALDEFRRFPCFSLHHPAMFIRLLIPNAFRGIAKRILYLDADLLCLGSMEALPLIDIDSVVAAAVPDEASTTAKTQIAALNLAHAEYFNAGVIYINVDNWIAEGVQEKALAALSQRNLLFGDQDALNLTMNGRVKLIEPRWNYRYHLVAILSKGAAALDVSVPVVFMHFTGPVKPWHSWCLHEAKDIFLNYQRESSWADVPLDLPQNARDLKLYSKFLIKQGRVLQGVGWHVRYLWKRMIG